MRAISTRACIGRPREDKRSHIKGLSEDFRCRLQLQESIQRVHIILSVRLTSLICHIGVIAERFLNQNSHSWFIYETVFIDWILYCKFLIDSTFSITELRGFIFVDPDSIKWNHFSEFSELLLPEIIPRHIWEMIRKHDLTWPTLTN